MFFKLSFGRKSLSCASSLYHESQYEKICNNNLFLQFTCEITKFQLYFQKFHVIFSLFVEPQYLLDDVTICKQTKSGALQASFRYFHLHLNHMVGYRVLAKQIIIETQFDQGFPFLCKLIPRMLLVCISDSPYFSVQSAMDRWITLQKAARTPLSLRH